MRRCLLLFLILCLLPFSSFAMEGAYLSGEELRALQPAFEAFLEELADTLVLHGILSEAEREAWLLYQLGDYVQNGGFGTISINYTDGLLDAPNEAVTLRRFSLETDAGLLLLETLRRYSEDYSPLPGVPLDVQLLDSEGMDVPCRWRWTAPSGSLLFYDGATEEAVNVGATYISDGRAIYWHSTPEKDAFVTLTLEILALEKDETLATATLVLASDGEVWTPEELR